MEKVQSNNVTNTRASTPVDVGKVGPPKDSVGSSTKSATAAKPVQNDGKQLPVNAAQRPGSAGTIDRAQLEAAADKVNEYAQQQQREVRFSVDQELGLPVVKVVDSSRDVVVRQIPSEVVIRLARNLEEYMEYSEQSGASASSNAENSSAAVNKGDVSGLAQGIEPGHLINTNA